MSNIPTVNQQQPSADLPQNNEKGFLATHKIAIIFSIIILIVIIVILLLCLVKKDKSKKDKKNKNKEPPRNIEDGIEMEELQKMRAMNAKLRQTRIPITPTPPNPVHQAKEIIPPTNNEEASKPQDDEKPIQVTTKSISPENDENLNKLLDTF